MSGDHLSPSSSVNGSAPPQSKLTKPGDWADEEVKRQVETSRHNRSSVSLTISLL